MIDETRDDTERLEWLCRYIRDCLDSDGALHKLTLLMGDAPSGCNCREAHCPHTSAVPQSMVTFRNSIDGARESGLGWTMRSIRE